MESGKLWEIFQNTGRVADYLAYRQSLLAETAQETHPEDIHGGVSRIANGGTYAVEDGRRRDP